MCVKHRVKHALSTTEQLTYWFVGLPIVLLVIGTVTELVKLLNIHI